jgi:TonB family protein
MHCQYTTIRGATVRAESTRILKRLALVFTVSSAIVLAAAPAGAQTGQTKAEKSIEAKRDAAEAAEREAKSLMPDPYARVEGLPAAPDRKTPQSAEPEPGPMARAAYALLPTPPPPPPPHPSLSAPPPVPVARVLQAITSYRRASDLWRQAGDLEREAGALERVAELYTVALGRHEDALATYERALDNWTRLEDHIGMFRVSGKIAVLQEVELGNVAKAIEACDRQRQAGRLFGSLFVEISALDSMAGVYERAGRFEEALATHEQVRKIFVERGSADEEFSRLYAIARVNARAGKLEEAVATLDKMLAMRTTSGSPIPKLYVFVEICAVSERFGRTERAAAALERARELHEEARRQEEANREARPSNEPVRVSGGVIGEKTRTRVSPEYPEAAMKKGVTGVVVVDVTVSEAGAVLTAVATSGPAELTAVAEEAARRWTFSPVLLDGAPMKFVGSISFTFGRR